MDRTPYWMSLTQEHGAKEETLAVDDPSSAAEGDLLLAPGSGEFMRVQSVSRVSGTIRVERAATNPDGHFAMAQRLPRGAWLSLAWATDEAGILKKVE